jgi:poly-gamma-glutamate capsule biosynthesis protein CapA/YwtB (metallophosphatase superfamily)
MENVVMADTIDFPEHRKAPTLKGDSFSIACVGDMIITIPFLDKMNSNNDCKALIELLGTADLVVGNYEGSIIDQSKFEGYPSALSGFGWLVTNPKAVPDLRALGVDMVSRANNHATDWGHEGLAMTNRFLEESGFVHAGTGTSLSEAREGSYITCKGGDIGLVSWTTEITADSPASDRLFNVRARPGVSALHRHVDLQMNAATWEYTKDLIGKAHSNYPWGTSNINGVTLLPTPGGVIEVDPTMTAPSARLELPVIERKVDEKDAAQILRGVGEANQKRDFTIAAQHHHGDYNNTLHVDKEVREFCRTAVDEGAHLIFGHGPHRLRGFEFYKDAPIFYSLGNFFFTDNTQEYLTWGEWDRYLWRVVNRLLPENERMILDPYLIPASFLLEWIRKNIFPSKLIFRVSLP